MTNAEYQREYYLKNRERKLAEAKERHRRKREEILIYSKKWRAKHPEYAIEKKNQWRKENPEKQKALAKKTRDKKRSDPKNRICESVSQGLRYYLKHKKEGKGWSLLLNFTSNELVRHLEKHFRPGMSWENYGKWHIDHKVPVSVFNFKSAEDIDFKRCWDLKNLQPMWAAENISKGNRLSKPFQPSLPINLYSALCEV